MYWNGRAARRSNCMPECFSGPVIASNDSAMKQHILDLQIHPQCTFDSFETGENALIVNSLMSIASGRSEEIQVAIWGGPQTGKTHLLQAVVHKAMASGCTPMYLPLANFADYEPELLQGLERFDMVCIDDMDAICNQQSWERRFVELLDGWRQRGVRIICTLQGNPAAGSLFSLPDLNSRLTWGAVHKLKSLNESGLEQALCRHAKSRGINLAPDVCSYLLTHCQRSIGELVQSLDRIARLSLSEHRKITVALLRRLQAAGDL